MGNFRSRDKSSSSEDKNPYNIKSLFVSESYKRHEKDIWVLKTFNMNNDKYIMSCSYDKTVLADNPTSPEDNFEFKSNDPVYAIAIFDIDDTYYVAFCGDNYSINVWNIKNESLEYNLEGHSKRISSLFTFKNDNDELILVSGSDDTTIKMWDLSSKSCVGTLEGHTNDVMSLVMYQKDNITFFASGSADSTIKLWDPKSQTCVSTLEGHSKDVLTLSTYVKDGKPFLVSGSYDRTIKIWDLSDDTLVTTLKKGHYDAVVSTKVVTKEDKNYLISGGGGNDDHLRFWDLDDFDEIHVTDNLTFSARSIEVYEKQLVTGHDNGTIKFWSVEE